MPRSGAKHSVNAFTEARDSVPIAVPDVTHSIIFEDWRSVRDV